MDAIHNKMMAVQPNLGKLEIEGDGATNPMTKEPGSQLCMPSVELDIAAPLKT